MAVTVRILTKNPERAQMVQRFWAVDEHGKLRYKLYDLARQFKMSSREVTRIAEREGQAQRDDVTCQACGTGYPLRSRAEIRARKGPAKLSQWMCRDCRGRQRRQSLAVRREAVAQAYTVALGRRVILSDLTPRQRLVLLALYQHAAYATWGFLQPVLGGETDFTPVESMDTALLTDLWQAGAITPHALFSDTAIQLTSSGGLDIKVRHVGWEVATFLDHARAAEGQAGIDSQALYLALQRTVLSDDFRRRHASDIEALAVDLAREEALRHLARRMQGIGVTLTRHAKARAMIETALTTHSLDQVCSLLGMAIRAASTRQATRPLPRLCDRPARLDETTVFAALRETLAKGRRGELTLDDPGRDYPLSALSRFVFDDLLAGEPRAFRPSPATPFTSRYVLADRMFFAPQAGQGVTLTDEAAMG